ncbi:MAG: magnesium transporter [Acidobacteriia bacterium]|nr:magnesium transporter [Terriglobia bacterium]
MSARDPIELVLSMPEEERRIWLRALAPDDAADLIQGAPHEEHPALLAALDPWPRAEVSALLAYKEDEAGGLMNPRFARLRPEMEIDEAIAYLRRQAGQVETIYYAYVLDTDQRLLGTVSLRDLLSARRDQHVRQLMRRNYQSVLEHERQEAVAKLMSDHRLLAIPVLDKSRVMQGIVTIDDAMQAGRESADEQLQKVGGMEALEGAYLDTTFRKMFRKRAGWLSALFLGEMLTATAIGFYEREITQVVMLAFFIPLIISSGGNSGSQAATLVIRAMALGEVHLLHWWRVLRRELLCGIGLGTALCAIGMTRIVIWHGISGAYGEHFARLALTVGTSLIGVVLFGTLTGSMLPLMLRACRFDPASASAPAVATLVDVTGLVIYFSMAKVFMLGVLR